MGGLICPIYGILRLFLAILGLPDGNLGLACKIGTFLGPNLDFGPIWDQVPNLGLHWSAWLFKAGFTCSWCWQSCRGRPQSSTFSAVLPPSPSPSVLPSAGRSSRKEAPARPPRCSARLSSSRDIGKLRSCSGLSSSPASQQDRDPQEGLVASSSGIS